MPRIVKPLTDLQVKNARPSERARTLFDGDGLHLLVMPNGSRLWRLKYRFNGRENRIALGAYPEVTLTEARDRTREARRLVANGVDPSAQRKAKAATESGSNSFETVARQWHAAHASNWTPLYAKKTIRNLEKNVFPMIGKTAVADVTRAQLRQAFLRTQERAVGEAHKARNLCFAVFEYAVAHELRDSNPTPPTRGLLTPIKKEHYATITEPRQVGALLRAIDGYTGTHAVACALKLAPLVFVRPGELRYAEWAHFHLDGKEPEWRIPGKQMKSGVEHRVPLSKQALAVLRRLRPDTGAGRYLFPGLRNDGRPISENTLNAALRGLGYSREQFTMHGFRAMASTLLNEQGWNRDAIESQLAHGEKDKVRAAYNHARYLPERRKMMQAWADYLDSLRKATTR